MFRSKVKFKHFILTIIVMTWLSVVRTIATSCSTGYYNNAGTCIACQSSCYTCINGTSCASCSSRILNSTTGLCDMCPDGYFYSNALNSCLSCNGSCRAECAYQVSCFNCSISLSYDSSGNALDKFSLSSMACVSNCGSNEVFIQDAQLRNLKLCRSLDYYVNPKSSEIVELGTQQYPYKNIALAFLEVLNYHSFSTRTVNIYLMENTTNYLMQNTNYVIGMTLVNIESYSVISSTPSRATVYGIGYSIPVFSSTTITNILADSTLRLTQIITPGSGSNSTLTSYEIENLSNKDSTVYVVRSSFRFNNVNAQRNVLTDYLTESYLIKAIYLQHKNITIQNMYMQITGYILTSNDPMSLLAENMFIDFHATMGGFVMLIGCNYPEAYVYGDVTLNNVTCDNMITRTAPFRQSLLIEDGPENVTVNATIIKFYGSTSEDRCQVDKHLNSLCMPNDDSTQIVNFNNSYWTLPSNPLGDRYICFYAEYIAFFYRPTIINYVNNYHENVVATIWAFNLAFVAPTTYIYMAGNSYNNITGIQCAAYTVSSANILLENEWLQNSHDYQVGTYALVQSQNVIMRNITHSNVNGTDNSAQFYIYLSIINSGNVKVDGMYFINCNLGYQPGFYVFGTMNILSISNVVMTGSTIGNQNALINTGSFSTLTISNCSFSNIGNQTPDDQSNFLISVGSIDLSSANNSTIQNVTINNSEVGFIDFSAISGSTSSSLSFTLSNIVYQNCYFKSQKNLIVYGNLESQQDVSFVINNVKYKNITFLTQGNIMMLEHQLSNQLVIANSSFSNITSGIIYIKSANKQMLSIPTGVKFVNSTFTLINSQYGSLISINEGGQLVITGCTFSQITCLEEGSVIYAGFQRTTTSIYSSTFVNNTSVQGGVFIVDSESVIKIYNSSLSYNFGVVSGVIQASNNGYFEIYGSHIHHNYAISSSVSQIFDVVTTPIIDSSQFDDNIVIDSASLTSELTVKCVYLCFLPSSLKSYLIANKNLYNQVSSNRVFQLIQGSLIIQNGCTFNNEESLVDCFISQLSISNSQFYSDIVSEYLIKITSSTATITNCTFYGLSSTDDSGLIQTSFGSNLTASGISYSNSTLPFINSISSTLSLSGISLSNLSSSNPILSIDGSTSTYIRNSVMSTLNSTNYEPFVISNSEFSDITNVTISNFSNNPISIKRSNINLIDQIKISLCTLELFCDTSIITLMKNSVFQNMGTSISRSGGAIHLSNSNATISNCSFSNNVAMNGGALYYSCLGSKLCSLSIQDSTFSNNSASEAGGAFFYDMYRPGLSNNIFYNNSASYGNNIASYPIKIKQKDSSQDQVVLNNIGSGISDNINFVFGLYDYDDQITSLDNVSQITIKSVINNTLVSGATIVKVTKGVAAFDNVIFTSYPGYSNVSFGLTSKAIDLAKARKQISLNYALKNIIVNFRFCQPGEIQANDICIACSAGSYSLEWNATKCENCIGNANCLGQTQISLESGFWRYSKNSTFIVECPNINACLGGFVDNNEYPVNCEVGYSGLLCSECQIYNDTKYEKLTDFQCAKCPDPILNALKVFGLGLIVLLFIAILIIVNVRKRKESQTSILMRIMANYMQIITATLSYSMKFPAVLTNMFFPVQQIGTGSDSLLSFDCFASTTKMTLFAPSTAILKVFMTAILPILLSILSIVVWAILYYCFPKKFSDFKRNVVVSIITILFLLHPTLTKSALGMFQCIQIDTNISKVRIDLNITCYSGEHLAWCAFIAIPMFVVWVFGCPLIALYFLIKNRHNLNDTTIQKYFIVLYQGLKDDRFYWEFVNTLRKVIIVSINVFLSGYSLFYKGVSAIILIIVLVRIQMVLDPYKLKVNNECELASFTAAGMTLYGGLLYVSDVKRVDLIDVVAFILILVVNIYFILLWVYLMSFSFDRFKYVRILSDVLRALLWRKNDIIDHDLVQPSSTMMDEGMRKPKPILRTKKKYKNKKKGKRKNIESQEQENKSVYAYEESLIATPKLRINNGIVKKKRKRIEDTKVIKITKYDGFSADSSLSSLKRSSTNRHLSSRRESDFVLNLPMSSVFEIKGVIDSKSKICLIGESEESKKQLEEFKFK